ncbi:MAG: AAA family ATPase [Promethearchaeota archaeon]
MVILRQLKAQDFKHLDVDFTFPQGILAISGPNESGKSSIFEAVLFAFFGRTHKAPMGNKDRLINYDADKLFVRLHFEIDGTTYRIIRHLHKNRPSQADLHKISPKGELIPLATGVTNVNSEIESLLNGIGLNDLLASNVVLQKDLDRLSQMAKMERRDIINAMMGRDCFTRSVDKLANDLRPLKPAQISEHNLLKELKVRHDEYLKNQRECEEKQESMKKIEVELKNKSQVFAQTEKKFRAVKAYKTAKEERERIQREIEHNDETTTQLEAQIASLGKLQPQQKKLQKQAKQREYLEKDDRVFQQVLAGAEQLQAKIDEQNMASKTISSLEEQIGELAPLQEVVREYEIIKEQRHKAEATQRRVFSPLLYIPSISLLSAGIVAIFLNLIAGLALILISIPFLGYLLYSYFSYSRIQPRLQALKLREQELSDQVAQYRAKETFQSQLTAQLEQKQQLTNQISILSQEVHSKLQSLSPALLEGVTIRSYTEVPNLQNAVKTVEKTLLGLKANRDSVLDQLQSINDQLSRFASLKKDLTQSEKRHITLQEQLAQISLPILPDDIQTYSEKLYEELDQQHTTLGQEKVRLQTQRESTKKRLDELVTELKANEGVIEEYAQKEQAVKKLDENLKSGQLTIQLIREVAERGREQVRPRVVNVMERILAAITDGKYRFPKLSEDFSLKVYSAEAGEYVDANLYSGGTEDQFLLALRLGFAIALLPQGRGATPQFLFLDEPFGGSDIQRRDNIIRLLKDELSQRFQQIIVVSHQTAVLSASEYQFRMANGRLFHSD